MPTKNNIFLGGCGESIGGAVLKTTVAPLETIRTHLMVRSNIII